MLLVIGKPAVFDRNNMPVRGQCQPHTKGWNLRVFSQGKEEILHSDTYYICRQIQLNCSGIIKLEKLKEIVQDVRKTLLEDTQETVVMDDAAVRGYPPSENIPLGDAGEVDTVSIPRKEIEEAVRKRSREDFKF